MSSQWLQWLSLPNGLSRCLFLTPPHTINYTLPHSHYIGIYAFSAVFLLPFLPSSFLPSYFPFSHTPHTTYAIVVAMLTDKQECHAVSFLSFTRREYILESITEYMFVIFLCYCLLFIVICFPSFCHFQKLVLALFLPSFLSY